MRPFDNKIVYWAFSLAAGIRLNRCAAVFAIVQNETDKLVLCPEIKRVPPIADTRTPVQLAGMDE
jgi:hypothetical protein